MQLISILLIVLTSAAVVAVVFLVLLFIQLRRTAREASKTMIAVRALAQKLGELDLEIKTQVEELGNTFGVFKKAATGLSEAALLVTLNLFPAPAKFFMFVLPVVRLLMRQIKIGKENHNVE